jgi:hypothetical protein
MIRASLIAPPADDSDYVLVGTAAAGLACIADNRQAWSESCDEAQLSLEAYEAQLKWRLTRSIESADSNDSELDRTLPGVRFTAELAIAVTRAGALASLLAGNERPSAKRLLPTMLLGASGVDASSGLPEGSRLKLRDALMRTGYGAVWPDLDDFLGPDPTTSPSPAPPADEVPEGPSESSSNPAGFTIGTFVGAFVLASLGGMSLGLALGLAFVVRYAATRRASQRVASRYLAPVSAVTLLLGIGLALTGTPDLRDGQRAAELLSQARADIAHNRPELAMQKLGGAALFEDQSVSVLVLASCVDWALRYRDWALFEAQRAIDAGYRPQEATHYRGRGCFLDVGDYAGVSFMSIKKTSQIVILVRPDRADAEGQRLLDIAISERRRRPTETNTALGCLAARYDMTSLASYFFTAGLNGSYRLGLGKSPHPEIIACLGALKGKLNFRHDIDTGIDVYTPVDGVTRIPSPRRHTPPQGVCWAKFPTGGPLWRRLANTQAARVHSPSCRRRAPCSRPPSFSPAS